MAARLQPVMVRKIRDQRRQGFQISAIAATLNLARSTVSKYAAKVDQQAQLEDVMAGLTVGQRQNLMKLVSLPVGTIEALVRAAGVHLCTCGAEVVYLPSSERFSCSTCGSKFRVNEPKQAPGQHGRRDPAQRLHPSGR